MVWYDLPNYFFSFTYIFYNRLRSATLTEVLELLIEVCLYLLPLYTLKSYTYYDYFNQQVTPGYVNPLVLGFTIYLNE